MLNERKLLHVLGAVFCAALLGASFGAMSQTAADMGASGAPSEAAGAQDATLSGQTQTYESPLTAPNESGTSSDVRQYDMKNKSRSISYVDDPTDDLRKDVSPVGNPLGITRSGRTPGAQ